MIQIIRIMNKDIPFYENRCRIIVSFMVAFNPSLFFDSLLTIQVSRSKMYVQERRGKMAKYEHEAKVVLEAVGGKENIQSLTHCMTRLRLVLNDASKVDKTHIAALTAIKGTAFQSGQFHRVIS